MNYWQLDWTSFLRFRQNFVDFAVSGRPPHPLFAGSLNSGAILSVPKPVIFGDFVDFGEFCCTPVQDFSPNKPVLERSFYSGANFVDFSLSEHVLERSFYSNAIVAARSDVILRFRQNFVDSHATAWELHPPADN